MNEFFSGLSNQHFVGELSLGVVFFRLFLAVVFGGLVGFERERKRKPAGFRTYILVCFGAAIVSMIQDQLRIHIIDFESTHSGLAAVIKTDLGRLGAQVIIGIGFLGAGSIIKESGESIAGMTTAAGIWATGCVGLGIGWGFYNIALVAIVFMLIIMIVLKTVESKIIKKSFATSLEISYAKGQDPTQLLEACATLLRKKSISITKIKKDPAHNGFTLSLSSEEISNFSEWVLLLSAQEGILSVMEK